MGCGDDRLNALRQVHARFFPEQSFYKKEFDPEETDDYPSWEAPAAQISQRAPSPQGRE